MDVCIAARSIRCDRCVSAVVASDIIGVRASSRDIFIPRAQPSTGHLLARRHALNGRRAERLGHRRLIRPSCCDTTMPQSILFLLLLLDLIHLLGQLFNRTRRVTRPGRRGRPGSMRRQLRQNRRTMSRLTNPAHTQPCTTRGQSRCADRYGRRHTRRPPRRREARSGARRPATHAKRPQKRAARSGNSLPREPEDRRRRLARHC